MATLVQDGHVQPVASHAVVQSDADLSWVATRGDRLSLPVALVLLGIASELLISANLLTYLGVPYVTDGGTPVLKLHPGSYAIVAGFLWKLASAPSSPRALWSLSWRQRRVSLFIGLMTVCALLTAGVNGAGSVIVFLDTYLPAGLAALVLSDASDGELRLLRGLLRAVFVVNAVLATIEALTQWRLVPFYLDGDVYVPAAEEFRPTAFYDHPLTGGLATLMAFCLAWPRTGFKRFRQVLEVGILAVALIAFGGRTTAGLGGLAVAGLMVRGLAAHIVLRRSVSVKAVVAIMATAFVAISLVAVAWWFGIGVRLLGHLYWDPSARVRVAQWQILGRLDWVQLAFGCRRDYLLGVVHQLSLSDGSGVIENFWLIMFLDLGFLGMVPFVAGFGCLLAWCAQQGRARAANWCLVGAFVIAASASNSLGRKSCLLVLLVAVAACGRYRKHAIFSARA